MKLYICQKDVGNMLIYAENVDEAEYIFLKSECYSPLSVIEAPLKKGIIYND